MQRIGEKITLVIKGGIKMNKNITILIFLCLFVFSFTICSGAFSYEDGLLTDDFGHKIKLEKVETVVSLSPSITEGIYMSGFFNKIIGVVKSSSSSNWPKGIEDKVNVGNINHVNIEKIVELDPDLIIGSGMAKDSVEHLYDLGYKAAFIEFNNIDDILDNMLVYGKLFNDSEKASEKVNELENVITKTKKKIDVENRKTAVFLYNVKPLMAMGNETIPNQVLKLAGLKNVVLDIQASGNPSISIEKLLELDPEYIFLAMRAKSAKKTFADNPIWQQLTAVKNENVYIPPTEHVLRSTPRVIYGIKNINEMVYCND